MSCTRLYVDPTETLTGKGMKMTLLRNGQSCQYRYPDLILLKSHSPLPTIRNALID